jgi:hypothetical protein
MKHSWQIIPHLIQISLDVSGKKFAGGKTDSYLLLCVHNEIYK